MTYQAELKKEVLDEEVLKELAEMRERIAHLEKLLSGHYLINHNSVYQRNDAEHFPNKSQEAMSFEELQNLRFGLTDRETEILNLMSQGYLNKQIAVALGITESTIKNHVSSILKKLDVHHRTQAVITAFDRGLVCLSKTSSPEGH